MIRSAHVFPIIFIAVYIITYYVVILFLTPGSHSSLLIQSVFAMVGPFLAALTIFHAYTRSERWIKPFWFFLGTGTFIYFIGEVYWFYVESVLQEGITFPGPADYFYFLQVICFITAFVYFLLQKNKNFHNARFLIEMTIVMITAFTFTYHFIIRDIIATRESGDLFLLIYIGYPAADLAILFGVLLVYFRSKDSYFRICLHVLTTGIVLFTLADALLLYLLAAEAYMTGSLIDPLFTLALFLIGYSAYMYRTDRMKESPIHQGVQSQFIIREVILPYGSTVILIIVFIASDGSEVNSLTIGISLVIFLITLRQVLALLGSRKLLHEFNKQNKQLEISTQRYRSIFENHPDPVYSLNLSGEITMINSSFSRLAGEKKNLFFLILFSCL
ncbi:PAS domain-containing protein [Thalassobacillus sp. C254]|uniref:PAS domain-containing protein n=1 Tax=Thalassobacillus sp. C254 TaxID=1225341 RepID=UPI0006D1FFF6|nr:PAS domain-containing protein [Thalassobacillus sp. C254]